MRSAQSAAALSVPGLHGKGNGNPWPPLLQVKCKPSWTFSNGVKSPELIPRGYKFPIGDNPFPVFDANVGKIGFLPADLAVKVAGFYGYAGGIVQDLGTINSEKIAKWSENEFRETFAGSIEELMKKGGALVVELQKEAAEIANENRGRVKRFSARSAMEKVVERLRYFRHIDIGVFLG